MTYITHNKTLQTCAQQEIFAKIALLAVFCITLLSGCLSHNTPSTTTLPVLIEQQNLTDEVRFEYLLQYSGGRYAADPAANEYISAIGGRLARLAGYKLVPNQFAVVNSNKIDAWVSPEGRVAVSRGMLTLLSNEAELAALLGHLLTHAEKQHGAVALARDTQATTALVQQRAEHHSASYVVGAGRTVLGEHAIRYNSVSEQSADRAAITMMIKAGYDPQAAVDLQLKMLGKMEGRITPWLIHHAANQERLAATRQQAHSHPTELSLAKNSYQDALKTLFQYEKAYQQQPLLQQLIDENSAEAAIELAQRLILIAPREGRFYALKGDALQKAGKTADAINAYHQALAADRYYFVYHLRLAELYARQQATAAARQALLESIQRLPTAKGYFLLAQLAEQQGQLAGVKAYYQRAALSDSALGREADHQAKRLDFDENPNRYLHIKYERTHEGGIRLFITNLSPLPVVLKTVLLKTDKTYRISLNQKIPAGNSISPTVTIDDLGQIKEILVDQSEQIIR
ncbi:MAG: M48 family metalloprotease [Gammaproteobacteria bacterium]|nr:M48 family metalloprotease [Gammaproteobacteria bacterium]MCF6230758.1 M48 family metalloprotease [Gammaproteobacteria bacterium]